MSLAPVLTKMRTETLEAAAAVARQQVVNRDALSRLGASLRQSPPPLVVTCARGSSDHAASYAKYAIETHLGVPVASHAPSVSSLYGRILAGHGRALFVVISQSGRSPDILASMEAARAAGARVLALVNDETSPAAALADVVLPLCAGPEIAVAATKSFVAALAGIAGLLAHWSLDGALATALERAPDALEKAAWLDWSAAVPAFANAGSLYTIGRGLTYGVAAEAALKLKETSALHAECFSAAEVRHGPMALVREGFPALMFVPDDATRDGFEGLAADMAARGASVFAVGGSFRDAISLPAVSGLHPLVAPMAQAVAFYGFAEALARQRGRDPDNPPGLAKVTKTR